MRAIRPLAALAWRESRFARRRLLLFLSSITLGVAALVATQSFAASMAAGVRDQSKAFTGADISLSSNQAFGAHTTALLDSLRRSRVPVARVTSFVSMALAERTGAARLAQVRAVEPGFPFYGEIETLPAGRYAQLQSGRNALVDPALLAALDARVGDVVQLGETRFTITGTLEKVPGSVGVGAMFAPRIYVPARYVAETGLVQFGSRVDYEAHVRLPAPGAAERLVEGHRVALRGERVSARTADDQQADLDRALRRLGSFLALIGTFALLLGGIGVASAMGAYMAQKRETVATLRCLGATAPQVIAVYLLQAGAMGLLGAGAGTAIGMAVQWVLPRLLSDLLPVEVEMRISPAAVGMGIGVGLWVALAFALLPLLATRRISPLQAIRRRVEPVGSGWDAWTAVGWTVLAASVVGLVLLQAQDLRTGLSFAAGVGVALAALWAAAWLLSAAARRAPARALGYPARQGIANLHRPGNQTRVVVLALGFGVWLLATVYLVQRNLLAPLRVDAASQGNLLLFDIQADQEQGVSALLGGQGARVLQRAPIIPMRIQAINGVPAAQLAPDDPDADSAEAEERPREGGPGGGSRGERRVGENDGRPERWAVRREYRSTFRDTLVRSETLRDGRMWTPGAGAAARGGIAEVSMDVTVAEDLRIGIGDTVTWDVQGVRIATRVTSLREVDWGRLEPNFFAVFPSAVLEGAPQTWLLLARAPTADARAAVQRDIVRRYSNVAVLDLTAIQAALDEVLGRVAAVIRFLAAFSVATGFVVLLGAVLTGRLQRIRESVLLRTLGATRRQVAGVLFSEYVALGMLASMAGIALAVGAGWALSEWVFETKFSVPVPPLLVLAAGVTALAAAVGLLASRDVFRHTPLEALREE